MDKSKSALSHIKLLSDYGYKIEEHEKQGKFSINTITKGIIDYYPKANKILIRNKNKWISDGLNWIKTTLIAQLDYQYLK